MRQCDWRNYFVPRDAMHSADYAVARCLSVSLSVTKRLISQLFPIPVFSIPAVMAIFRWELSNSGANAKGYENHDFHMKITIFDQYLELSR